MASPDFSGICFLDLNVELLLELSRGHLHCSTGSEASCVSAHSCLCGSDSLIGSRVLRSCSALRGAKRGSTVFCPEYSSGDVGGQPAGSLLSLPECQKRGER